MSDRCCHRRPRPNPTPASIGQVHEIAVGFGHASSLSGYGDYPDACVDDRITGPCDRNGFVHPSTKGNQMKINRRKFVAASMSLGVAAVSSVADSHAQASAPSAPSRPDPNRWRRNEKIQQGRRMASSLLQPSERDLERGLALHAEALVCDVYGLGVHSAPDTAPLNLAVQAGASAPEYQDLRLESTTTRHVQDAVEREEYIDAWEAAGVTCVFQNAGEEGQWPMQMLRRLSSHTFVGDCMRGHMIRAALPQDIVAAKKQHLRCNYLTTNGVPLQQEWNSVEEELYLIRLFFNLGVRMMHLTYSRRNMIGDGCAEPSDAGLSDFGRRVVREMNRIGVIVDLAHSGWKTSLEAARHAQKPVVISHSACAALNHHVRCQPDEVIRAVADTGGYIGITCVPRFLGGTGDIRALLDHIDYVVKKFGADHVAIGTDTPFSSRTASASIVGTPRSRPKWATFGTADNWTDRPEMRLSMLWTNWPLFTVGLVQRGHSEETIRKIIGGNMMRVARAVLPPWIPTT